MSFTEIRNEYERGELGYASLLELRPRSNYANLVGIVTSFKSPKKSRGTDYVGSTVITDPKSDSAGGSAVVINYFKSSVELLPKVMKIGDVLFCKEVKIQPFGNKTQAISTKSSSWMVLDGALNSEAFTKSSNFVSHECDFKIAQWMKEWWLAKDAPLSVPVIKEYIPPRSQRLTLKLSQVKPLTFFDFIGEVVKVSPGHFPSCIEIQLTDYTTNHSLPVTSRNIEDPYAVYGPRVVQCLLWDENVEIGEKLSIGSYVLMRNLNAKISPMGYLEFKLHGDKRARQNSEPNVMLLDKSHPQVADLNRQKKEFLHEANIEFSRNIAEGIGLDNNQITVIKHTSQIPTSIDDIINHTEVNGKFRIRARLTDYMPEKIEDFARPYCTNCNKSLLPTREQFTQCPECSFAMSKYSFIYMFALLLEDRSRSTLPVYLYGKDARNFFDGLPPTNLYADQETRNALQQRFRKLWDGPRLTPYNGLWFDCCIKSYTVTDEDGGLVKRYRMFDTTLLYQL
ncbi:hypothetical protein K7432_012539 [Basidiobolus ranarum]|uniref:Protection of telomeres protein 1 n=1 Tax=Basidiobolus ranarum TaxID=34480 RepID=A0ABR2WKM2_9FUNG